MRLLMTLLVLALAQPVLAQEAPGRRISVTGEGSVEVAPDMAQISLGVTTEAETAQAALAANSDATSAVLTRLEQAGIEARDMQTSNLSLYPRYDDRPMEREGTPPVVGFIANHMVTIRVRELDALGGILDAVVADGANTLNGLTFGLQDPAAATDEARRRAVADAMRKAGLYAEAAGVTLGPVLSITEQGGAPGPVMLEARALSMADTKVAEGELSITSTIGVEFGIAD